MAWPRALAAAAICWSPWSHAARQRLPPSSATIAFARSIAHWARSLRFSIATVFHRDGLVYSLLDTLR